MMKTYKILFDRKNIKELEKIPLQFRNNIREKINNLAWDPRPEGCAKLQGAKSLYRIRCGDYRVVYEIKDSQLIILIIQIGHRKEICRDL